MPDFPPAQPRDASLGLFSLTQIRHLMRVEFGRAQRYGYAASVMVLEIDRVGHLRDLYGFEFKESVLEDVISLLQDETRSCDYLGRLQDDRLMAILPHTTEKGARSGADRLMKRCHQLGFEADGRALKVSLSIGCSLYEDQNTLFFDALVSAAEAALAEAIAQGGDRFVFRAPGS